VRFAFLLLAALAAAPAPPPHYASLRSDKVYLREGPTYQHRVLFTYKRKDYPVQVLAAYESWRRVRDADGTVGWISQTMLSDARTVLVTGQGKAELRSSPTLTAQVSAEAEPGVVGKLKACKPQFCKITAGGVTGWIDRTRIWGVDAGEIID
jgi:SH3-like domain-containing protein